jgi:rubrerythrin
MPKTTEHDEARLLRDLIGRAPDAIVPTRMVSIEWRCDRCGEVFKTEQPVSCPAPCVRCGAVCFSTFAEWHGRSPH